MQIAVGFSGFSRWWTWLLVSLFVCGPVATPAWGEEAAPPAPETTAAASSPEKEARGLFAQGQLHYSLGEYSQAVAQFRRAYELTAAPGLLFNIAQAHRLAGDCKRALEVYRHFIRLAPESQYRPEAETQIAALTPACGASAAVALAVPSGAQSSKPADGATPLSLSLQADVAAKPAHRWSMRRRMSAALLAGGVGLGAAAGGLYWWNDGRYDQWRQEDRRLSAPMAGAATGTWVADQQRNDSLLHSIQQVDTINLVLVGVSVAAVIVSAITLVLIDG